MVEIGLMPVKAPQINIPDAQVKLEQALQTIGQHLGEELIYHSDYDQLADWMSDNKRQGIIFAGNVGRGKTLTIKKLLPLLLSQHSNIPLRWMLHVHARDKALDIPGYLFQRENTRLFFVDDMGVEPPVEKRYGVETEYLMSVIVDAAEQNGGQLVFGTTNLTKDELRTHYGDRTFDRLNKLCRFIFFEGQSFRQ